MAPRKRFFRNRRTALWVGYLGVGIGTVALWDAYDNRGKSMPLGAKFIPGL